MPEARMSSARSTLEETTLLLNRIQDDVLAALQKTQSGAQEAEASQTALLLKKSLFYVDDALYDARIAIQTAINALETEDTVSDFHCVPPAGYTQRHSPAESLQDDAAGQSKEKPMEIDAACQRGSNDTLVTTEHQGNQQEEDYNLLDHVEDLTKLQELILVGYD
ncbi:hypothetical protein BCR37DRAFT_257608 [Protomyces lactucae-debilis]|uniref:Mediator of RNA polymerase II transcription subunit 11 n=1 Tax=Protomyces lactucae-debilis TaxID=2754530 RepID=A0A1Y2FM57_PROLT|nr:uncharacterized protein BCR37DRAFT_257608 [Protomyces lactucae-debilis]ORY85062.1 hypothetical protein BCR37DRAFT_257608 [Protomyces lactucae-debilis]